MNDLKAATIKVMLNNGIKMALADKDLPPKIKKLILEFRGGDPSSIEVTDLGDCRNQVHFKRDGEDEPVSVYSSSSNGTMGTFVDGNGRMRTILIL